MSMHIISGRYIINHFPSIDNMTNAVLTEVLDLLHVISASNCLRWTVVQKSMYCVTWQHAQHQQTEADHISAEDHSLAYDPATETNIFVYLLFIFIFKQLQSIYQLLLLISIQWPFPAEPESANSLWNLLSYQLFMKRTSQDYWNAVFTDQVSFMPLNHQYQSTYTHNHFTALLNFVQDYPCELAPER